MLQQNNVFFVCLFVTFGLHAVIRVAEETKREEVTKAICFLVFRERLACWPFFVSQIIHVNETSEDSFTQRTLPLPASGRATLFWRQAISGDTVSRKIVFTYFKIKVLLPPAQGTRCCVLCSPYVDKTLCASQSATIQSVSVSDQSWPG